MFYIIFFILIKQVYNLCLRVECSRKLLNLIKLKTKIKGKILIDENYLHFIFQCNQFRFTNGLIAISDCEFLLYLSFETIMINQK